MDAHLAKLMLVDNAVVVDVDLANCECIRLDVLLVADEPFQQNRLDDHDDQRILYTMAEQPARQRK